MKLGLKNVPRAVSILEDPSSALYDQVLQSRLSLSSAVALAFHGRSTGNQYPIQNELLMEVNSRMNLADSRQVSGSLFQKQKREIYLIRGAADLVSEHFDFFCDRFRRSVVGRRNDQGYKDLREALYEMSDNIVAHSGGKDGTQRLGIVAYEAGESGGCFTVCDSGCGFVESLSQNAKWKAVTTHHAAISAVVLQQATRRETSLSGGGFKGLFAALAELNSVTLIRSGDCLAKISTTKSGPELEFSSFAEARGAQVSVIFSKSGVPGEEFH